MRWSMGVAVRTGVPMAPRRVLRAVFVLAAILAQT
jgi:hypothetical protein